MIRKAVHYIPHIRLFRRPKPTHGPFFYDVMAEAWRMFTVITQKETGGRASNILWTPLSGDKTQFQDFDGMPGAPSKWQAAACTCDYDIRWDDRPAGGNGYIHKASPEEEAEVELAKANYVAIIDRIKAIDEDDRTEDQAEQLQDAENLLSEINLGGLYLRTMYNGLDTSAQGVFWGLSVPNVPVIVTSAFKLKKDRSISFRLKRYAAPPEQARYFYTIELQAGQTCYALRIGEDGNSSEFFHYRNMTRKAREKLMADLDTVLDRARLTMADRKRLQEIDDREQTIRTRAKKRPSSERKLTEAEETEIEQLKEEAKKIKEAKQALNDADEEKKRQIEKKLYLARETFLLKESARSLLDEPIDFTVKFLRTGFVVISSNKKEFVYENKRITTLVPPQYATMFPANGQIIIRSDGGKWGLVTGHPNNKNGSLWGPVLEVPFAVQPEDATFQVDGDASGPGCLIVPKLEVITPYAVIGTIPRPARVQVRVDLLTNNNVPKSIAGQYTPELTRLELHIPGGAVPEYGEEIWSSQAPENLGPGGQNRIKDVLLQADGSRDCVCAVHIDNSGGEAHLPANLAGLTADIALLDQETNTTHTVVSRGRVAVGTRNRLKTFTFTGEEIPYEMTPDVGHEGVLEISSVAGFLNKEIQFAITGHNQYPNDYLRALARDAGLPASTYAGIPAGDIGIPRIARPIPGRYPDVKPSSGAFYWEWMQNVVREHCPGWELTTNAQGLLLRRISARFREDRSYNIPPAIPMDSRQCLRNTFTLTQDLRGYVTTVIAIGAKDPLTGIRYSARETNPQAYSNGFENSMYFVDDEIIVTLPVDDSLRSNTACLLRARERLARDGRPPWEGGIEIDYDHTLRTLDQVTVYGVKFDVEEIDLSALNAGEGQRMRVGLRLAEDRRI